MFDPYISYWIYSDSAYPDNPVTGDCGPITKNYVHLATEVSDCVMLIPTWEAFEAAS